MLKACHPPHTLISLQLPEVHAYQEAKKDGRQRYEWLLDRREDQLGETGTITPHFFALARIIPPDVA